MKTLKSIKTACLFFLIYLSSVGSENENKTGGIVGKVDKLKEKVSSVAEKAKEMINSTKESISSSVDSIKETAAASKSMFSTEDDSSVCYGDLDCFTNAGVWHTATRPFPLPQSPAEIETKLYLYTRDDVQNRYTVTLRPNISLHGSRFDSSRSNTAFLTHGFASDGNSSWLTDMKDAYLKKRDANFFIVDWGKGASSINYLQVGANTRVVAAELIRFVKYLLKEHGLSSSKIHLLGHSLGAQISAYVGKAIQNINHLTAFDPAQPGFEGEAKEVHLAKGDAELVEIIHTNGRPFIPYLGFGYINAAGDIDYFMNGGQTQPGCSSSTNNEPINSLSDLLKYSCETLSKWLSCSHGKSYEYYTEALSNNNCTFWGLAVNSTCTMEDNDILAETRSLIQKAGCTLETCSPIGLEHKTYPARGNFVVFTNAENHFCINDVNLTKLMIQLQEDKQSSNACYRYEEEFITLLLSAIVVGALMNRYTVP